MRIETKTCDHCRRPVELGPDTDDSISFKFSGMSCVASLSGFMGVGMGRPFEYLDFHGECFLRLVEAKNNDPELWFQRAEEKV